VLPYVIGFDVGHPLEGIRANSGPTDAIRTGACLQVDEWVLAQSSLGHLLALALPPSEPRYLAEVPGFERFPILGFFTEDEYFTEDGFLRRLLILKFGRWLMALGARSLQARLS